MMRLLVMVAAVACAAPPKKAAPKKPQWHGCDEVRHWAASHRHDHTPATGWGGVFKGAVSHSQFGQDLVIVSIVQSLSKMNVSTWSPPFSYVDLATNDPLEGSNTFLLDACFSWKGVCVEPNAVYREAILEKRSCPLVDTCVSDEERTVKFVNDFSLGHVVGRRLKPELTELRCTTLRRILEGRSPRVTYLSLDVEGHELAVLAGADWNRTVVDLLTLENADASHVAFLRARGIVPVLCVGIDTLFAREALVEGVMAWFANNEGQLPYLCVDRNLARCFNRDVRGFSCAAEVGVWNAWQKDPKWAKKTP